MAENLIPAGFSKKKREFLGSCNSSSGVGLAEHACFRAQMELESFYWLGVFFCCWLSLTAVVLWLQVSFQQFLANTLSSSDLSGKEGALLSSSCRDPPEILSLWLDCSWFLPCLVGAQPGQGPRLPSRGGWSSEKGWGEVSDTGSRSSPVCALVGQSWLTRVWYPSYWSLVWFIKYRLDYVIFLNFILWGFTTLC